MFHQAAVLGGAALGREQLLAHLPLRIGIGLLFVHVLEQPSRLRDELVDDASLLPHEAGDLGVVPLVDILVAGTSRRPADDQGGAGLVDEDGVDLVDDREEVLALYAILQTHDHVVAEVIEAELVVRPVRDVTLVRPPTICRAGRGLVQTTHLEAEVLVYGPHPLGVTASQVVVDGDQVGTAAGEGVQI